MATVIVALIAGVLLAVVVPRVARWRPQRGRMVECASCGRVLPVKRAKVVASVGEWAEGPGGVATVAEYHRRCARREGVK